LEGSTIRPDNDANERVYGPHQSARDIVLSPTTPVPPSAAKMVATLNKFTPKHR